VKTVPEFVILNTARDDCAIDRVCLLSCCLRVRLQSRLSQKVVHGLVFSIPTYAYRRIVRRIKAVTEL